MKITFIPAIGAGTKEGVLTADEAPGRITQRERLPAVAEAETSDEFKMADTDPLIPVVSAKPAKAVKPGDTAKPANGAKRPMIYRSVSRPAMAVLTALDDGSLSEGEQWRIRSNRFVIGRTAGDCVISHDPDISGRHLAIVREARGTGFHWILKDLTSTNGLFVQVRRVVLRHGQELLLGGRRYEFQCPSMLPQDDDDFGAQGTRRSFGQWQCLADFLRPRLVELTPVGEGSVLPLHDGRLGIGSDADCEISISDDPFLSPRHAHFTQDRSGRWVLTDNESWNGILVRVDRVSIEGEQRFQIGGQRFLLRVL